MKSTELKNLDVEALNKKLMELRKELSKLNTSVASGVNPKSPGQIKATKKNIARILTFINQKKLAQAQQALNTKKTKPVANATVTAGAKNSGKGAKTTKSSKTTGGSKKE